MSPNIINQLQELQKQSDRRLNGVIRSLIQDHANPRALVKKELVANGQFSLVPVKGAQSLLTANNRDLYRKVKTFNPGSMHVMDKLNKELLGGENYPILTALLGFAAGPISAGGSVMFSVANTALSLANTTSKVLARPGDEIWHHEKIGKQGNKVIYVSAFFIIDPYRKQANSKGWLIDEVREEITIS